jgi:hypothetical protein
MGCAGAGAGDVFSVVCASSDPCCAFAVGLAEVIVRWPTMAAGFEYPIVGECPSRNHRLSTCEMES